MACRLSGSRICGFSGSAVVILGSMILAGIIGLPFELEREYGRYSSDTTTTKGAFRSKKTSYIIRHIKSLDTYMKY